MSIADRKILDRLNKKIQYYVTETDADNKSPENETITSVMPVFASSIWKESDSITSPPPGASGSVIQVYDVAAAVLCTFDPTVTNKQTWLTGLVDWIPPYFDSLYTVKVYAGDPNTTGVLLNPFASNQEWEFDYSAGVVHFPNIVPTLVSTADVYVVGYRYIGQKGVGVGGGGTGNIETLNALDGANQTLTTSITGTALSWLSTGTSHTLKIPLASLSATGGLVTQAEYTTWNAKQTALGYTPINKAGDTGIGALSLTGPLTIALGQGLIFGDGAPAPTTNKLYQVGGALYWNGSALATGGAAGVLMPQVIKGNPGNAGASPNFSREDHMHALVLDAATGLKFATTTLTQDRATASVPGYLHNADFFTFAAKVGPTTTLRGQGGITINGSMSAVPITNGATLVIDASAIAGSVVYPLWVNKGGTGLNSLPSGKIVYGTGSGITAGLLTPNASYFDITANTLNITPSTLTESLLDINNTPGNPEDGYVLTWDKDLGVGGKMAWQAPTATASNVLEDPDPLGSDHVFSDGAITSWTIGATTYSKAIDDLNEYALVLSKLIPTAPVGINGKTLSMTGGATTRSGLVIKRANGVTDSSGGSPPAALAQIYRIASSVTPVISSTVLQFGSGNSGTLTAKINTVAGATKALTVGDDSGTYTSGASSLTISNNIGYPTGREGFWEIMDASMSQTGLTAGQIHGFQLSHDDPAGSTSTAYFVYDSSLTPTATFATVTNGSEANLTHSSGVKHYGSTSTISVTGNITNLISKTYLSTNMVEITPSLIDDTSASGHRSGLAVTAIGPMVSVDAGQCGITALVADTTPATFTTKTFTISGNVHAQDRLTMRGRSSHTDSAYNTSSTFINVMSGTVTPSNAAPIQEQQIYIDPALGTIPGGAAATAIRATSTNGTDTPVENPVVFAGYTLTWPATFLLPTYEAAITGGLIHHCQHNYSSGYLPTTAVNYSAGRSGDQYITFYMCRSAVGKFDIAVTGKYSGCWVTADGISFTGTGGTNNWMSMFTLAPDAGLAGPGCARTVVDTGNNTGGASYTCTFGTGNSSSFTNYVILVRFKLVAGDYISRLAFMAPTRP